MTRFKVDTDELERVSARLAAMATLCDSLLTEVEALAASASAQWSGEADVDRQLPRHHRRGEADLVMRSDPVRELPRREVHE
jgi:hypothetical protein